MGKRLLAILTGIISSGLIVYLIELLSTKLYPPPPGLDIYNKEAMAKYMAHIPSGALAMVVLAYLIGAFGGSLIATLIAPAQSRRNCLVICILFLASTLYNLFSLPHPVLFGFLSIAVWPLGCWTGWKAGLGLKGGAKA